MYNKIKSFKEFINEFEIEGDVKGKIPKISPFTKEDTYKVEDIILNFQKSPIVKKYNDFIKEFIEKNKNKEIRHIGYTGYDFYGDYITGGDWNFRFNIGRLDMPKKLDISSKLPGLLMIRGISLLYDSFINSGGRSNIIFDNWFSENVIVFNYGELDNEVVSKGVYFFEEDIFNSPVMHSVQDFQHLINLTIQELENKFTKFTKFMEDLAKESK